jgi:hypothetical protein
VGLGRFELPTSRLSGVRSNQLSYRPSAGKPIPWKLGRGLSAVERIDLGLPAIHLEKASGLGLPQKGGDPATGSPTATLLRLHPNRWAYHGRLLPRRVSAPASGTTNFRDVTGGVYKARERIHPSMLIWDY